METMREAFHTVRWEWSMLWGLIFKRLHIPEMVEWLSERLSQR